LSTTTGLTGLVHSRVTGHRHRNVRPERRLSQQAVTGRLPRRRLERSLDAACPGAPRLWLAPGRHAGSPPRG